jgi:hypothetical protein
MTYCNFCVKLTKWIAEPRASWKPDAFVAKETMMDKSMGDVCSFCAMLRSELEINAQQPPNKNLKEYLEQLAKQEPDEISMAFKIVLCRDKENDSLIRNIVISLLRPLPDRPPTQLYGDSDFKGGTIILAVWTNRGEITCHLTQF